MRTIIRVFFVLMMTVVISCSKKETGPDYGEISMTLNGKPWNGKLQVINRDSLFSILVYTERTLEGVPIRDETFAMIFLRKTNKKQIFKNGYPDTLINIAVSDFSTKQDDGDVSCEYFKVLETDSTNNYLQVTQENNNYREVQGIFSVTLLKEWDCDVAQYPDTIRIRDGKFHLYIPTQIE